MRHKKLLLFALMGVVMVTSAVAGNFQIQDNTGSDLFILDQATGQLNITTGKIAEQGTLLEDLYCALTGCEMTDLAVTNLNVTGILNLSSATDVDFATGSINESDIGFDTACASGNHLYVSGGSLACEPDTVDTDTIWAIDGFTLINNSNTLEVNATWINETINALGITDTDTHVQADGIYLYNDTTTMYFNETLLNETINDSIVTYLSSDGYVRKTGDPMTGDLNMTGANVRLLTNSNITNAAGTTTFTIDSTGNVIFRLDP